MIFKCQSSALEELQKLADRDRHSLLIEGVSGCGKTYLAKQYAKLLSIGDFASVPSTVNDIRKAIDTCYNLESRVVLCIENLDGGVISASYTLLKFLEEPRDNIYIVVTCTNINKVPDTIISRSSVVTVSPPTPEDLHAFLYTYTDEKRKIAEQHPSVLKAANSFPDIDYVLNLPQSSYMEHLEDLINHVTSKKPINDSVWAIGHYPDNTEIPVKFAIKCIINSAADSRIRKHGISCIHDLDSSRVASHAVLSKFILECKYGE